MQASATQFGEVIRGERSSPTTGSRRARTRTVLYWATTSFLVFALISGGIGELTHTAGTMDTVTVLGYPVYVLTIIGAWKLIGSAVLLAPNLGRLKEWAYAGVLINMTSAAASHAFSNDFGPGAYHITTTLSLAVLAVISWSLRPSSRVWSGQQYDVVR